MGVDLGILSLVGSAVSGITGFMGQQQSAQAASDAANYQAQVAANNSIIAQQNAAYAAKAGEAQAETQGQKSRNMQGAITAALAANNVDVNSGSAADVRIGQRQAGLLDTENVRQDAALRAYGFKTQATNFQAESGLDKFKAANAQTAGTIGGIGSLLGGASSTLEKFSKFKDIGITGGGDTGLLSSGGTW